MTREICKICNLVNRVGFAVPDKVWNEVVPEDYKEKVVCLECFTLIADEKLVIWDKDILFYPVSHVTHIMKSVIEENSVALQNIGLDEEYWNKSNIEESESK